MVEAEIVEKVISAVPKQTKPLTTVAKHGETTLVGLVTVEARTANFVPVTYLLEWILIIFEGKIFYLTAIAKMKNINLPSGTMHE